MVGPEETNSKVSLEALAKLTGFPVEMIKDEIFKGQSSDQEISLQDLRAAMLTYIDKEMFIDSEK